MLRRLRTAGFRMGWGLAQRSLLVDMRDGRQCALRALLALGLLGTLLLIRTQSLAFAAPGLRMFGAINTVMFIAVTVLGVGTFASTVAEEREHATLGLLQMTGMRVGAIMFGKSIGALAQSLILLAVVLPFSMLCITLGGVARDQVLAVFVVMGGWLLLVCGVAVHASTVARSTQKASQWAGAVVAILVFLPLLSQFVRFAAIEWLGADREGAVARAIGSFGFWIAGWTPWQQLVYAEQEGDLGAATEIALVYLGAGVLVFVLGWLRFGRANRRQVSAGGRARSARDRGRPGAGLGAVHWKDYRLSYGGRHRMIGRWIAAGVLVVAISRNAFSAESAAGMLFGFAGLILFAEIAGVCARMVRDEIRDNTLEALVAMPWEIRALLWTKLWAGVRASIPWIAICCGSLLFLRGPRRIEDILAILVAVMMPITVCVLTLRFSVFMRRAAFGAALLIVILGAMLFGFLTASTGGEMGIVVVFLVVLVAVSGAVTLTLPDAIQAHVRGR